ncbi:MAG: ParB/RepB/Spo0J family partition protein [Flavobacteriales bacterium]|nr:ParB/RepB/Spo0J family partition protein [Flavobacteriales bacterium]
MGTMTKKRGLGRGLSALLEDPSSDITTRAPITEVGGQRVVGGVSELPVDQIGPNPFQPRTHFAKEALVELATSIRELGVIQPVTVRKVGYDRYQLISGERRFRAAQAAGLTAIPAFIRVANDEAMLEMALVENIQREDLDAIEVAISFKRLIDEVKLTQEQLSGKVGKDRTSVTNYLRLLKLQPEVQMGIRQRQIGMGHARALLAVDDPDQQIELFRRIVAGQMSVRQVEQIARETRSGGARTARASAKSRLHRETSRMLSDRFGTKVAVKQNAQGQGRIELAFRNGGELEALLNKLGV